jgi:hypothetical protein
MPTDRVTKALLLAIALGLWANAVGDWLRPVSVQAQANRFEAPANVTDHQLLREIEKGVTLMATGFCPNKKICG